LIGEKGDGEPDSDDKGEDVDVEVIQEDVDIEVFEEKALPSSGLR
jgi:hypothetical protein